MLSLHQRTYTVTIPGGVPVTSTIATSASPAAGGSTTGDGIYDNGTPVTVVATHNPGFAFVNWTEGGVEVSASAVYPFTVNADRTLVANFVADAPKLTVTVSPPTVVGGTKSTGKVTLTAPAPAGGAVVTLASDTPAATVPASLKVGAGATSKTFTVGTTPVAASTAATISASYSGTTAAATLTVTSVVPSGVTLNPTSVIGGVSSKGTVTLTGKAPAGGASITLSSSTLAASLPSPVTIPAGATSTTFQVTTVPVAVSTPTDISASYNGTTVQATLTVNPAVLSKVTLGATSVVGGVSVATNTVTLTGAAPPAGAQVTLTSSSPTATVPSSLTVPAGATSATLHGHDHAGRRLHLGEDLGLEPRRHQDGQPDGEGPGGGRAEPESVDRSRRKPVGRDRHAHRPRTSGWYRGDAEKLEGCTRGRPGKRDGAGGSQLG